MSLKYRIAILTQPIGENNGGILQVYALQSYLRNIGYDVLVINRRYNNEGSDGFYNQFMFNVNSIVRFVFDVLRGRIKKNIKKRRNKIFIDNNIIMSRAITASDKLRDAVVLGGFDAVIVGSDQTWRPKYSPDIYNYYLDFIEDRCDIKKISYASSFGVDWWEYDEVQTKKCRRLVKKFDLITVREFGGIGLCAKYLEVEANHALDPTMLFVAEDYKSKFKLCKSTITDNLFVYMLDPEVLAEHVVNMIKLGLPECDVKNQKIEKKKKYVVSRGELLSVSEWLLGIYNAGYVVTDSYHGCVFAIIFNKPFICVLNKRRGTARIETLLKIVGLENRAIKEESELRNVINGNIDWSDVESRIAKKRKESEWMLKKALAFK